MTLKELLLGDMRHLFRKKGGQSAPAAARRTAFHWNILVTAFGIAVVVVTVAGFFLYQRINQGDFTPSTPSRAARTPSESKLLQETLRNFEEKRVTFDAMKKGGVVPVDPSR